MENYQTLEFLLWEPWTDGREESGPMGTKGSQPVKSLLVSCLTLLMMQGSGLACLLDEVDEGCVKLE